jgi:hypothetical protein
VDERRSIVAHGMAMSHRIPLIDRMGDRNRVMNTAVNLAVNGGDLLTPEMG